MQLTCLNDRFVMIRCCHLPVSWHVLSIAATKRVGTIFFLLSRENSVMSCFILLGTFSILPQLIPASLTGWI